MARITTAGRAAADERQKVKAMVSRLLARYELTATTDADIKAVLRKVLAYLGKRTARYNIKEGGLGR